MLLVSCRTITTTTSLLSLPLSKEASTRPWTIANIGNTGTWTQNGIARRGISPNRKVPVLRSMLPDHDYPVWSKQ